MSAIDAREIRLDTGRGTLGALRAGTEGGPKLLCLHGWLDNAASYLPLLPHLRGFDLVALDLPGHGGSDHRAPGYDYMLVDWIHDVLDALDALGWQRTMLLGHSMGGAIATMVAVAAPERVSRLALIEALGPLAGEADDAGTRLRTAVRARRALKSGRPPKLIADLEQAVDARLAASNMTREAARLIVERNLRCVEGGFVWRSDPRLTLPSHLRVAEEFIRAWLRALEVPTFVLCSDPPPPFFSPELIERRLAEVADVRSATLAGGHHLHMEQPGAVAELLLPFLTAEPCLGRRA
jgi:pimeloyl-ACP methyl ester carboxylesterase